MRRKALSIVMILFIVLSLAGCNKKPIGGADGPTEIYIAE